MRRFKYFGVPAPWENLRCKRLFFFVSVSYSFGYFSGSITLNNIIKISKKIKESVFVYNSYNNLYFLSYYLEGDVIVNPKDWVTFLKNLSTELPKTTEYFIENGKVSKKRTCWSDNV